MDWYCHKIWTQEFDAAKQGVFPTRLQWYGVDSDGAIADFDSIASGFVPKCFFAAGIDAYIRCQEWIWRRTRELRDSVLYPYGPPPPSVIGLYAYMASDEENNDLSDVYLRWDVPAPESRLMFDKAPAFVQDVVGNVRYPGRFALSDKIVVIQEWECSHE